MFYGVGIFSRGGDLINKRLSPLYNKAFRYATGAFVTSPISALMAECGQLPFEYFLIICVMTKAIRWLSLKGNDNVPLVKRAIELFQEFTNQELPTIAIQPHPKIRPWNQQPPTIDLSLLSKVKAGSPPPIIQAHFLELRHKKYSNHHHIYTDGSVANNTIGYGITSNTTLPDISSSLPPPTSIFSAEAYAIMKATNNSSSLTDKPIVIFTDSASCLCEMSSSQVCHPWLQTAERSALVNRVSFCWIPGHAGILGNEEADRLAGAGRSLTPEDVAIPSLDAYRWIKHQVRDAWSEKWYNSRDFALRKIKPSTLPWPDQHDPKDRRTLSRLRIGHTRLTHSYRLEKNDPPTCSTCNSATTISHILIDCLKYNSERLTVDLPNTVEEALSPPNEEKLLQYLKNTGLFKEI